MVLASVLLALAMLAAAPGCGNSPAPSTPVHPVTVPVTKASMPLVVVPPPAFAEPQWQRASGAPLTLTASDGSGLTLTKMTARAVVNAPLAFTELTLTFDNPRDRVIEGTFSITLPPRATVSRFAMRTADGIQEGEVVERQAARRAYEDFLHRKQDPALMEQGAGNEFTARVFPIPARGQKELIVSYAEELPGDAPYALALKGLPEIAMLSVSVTGGHGSTQALTQERTVPAGDLIFDRHAAAQGNALRSGRMVISRVKPMADASPDPVRGLLVLMDTSGSRALGFADQTRMLRDLVAKLTQTQGTFPLRIACFDQSIETVFDGQSSAFGDRELLAIKARGALGASNLEQALGWAREHAAGTSRVLVISDGVTTAGATDAEHLRAAVSGLRAAGVGRMDAMAVGGIRDEGTLKTLAVGGLSRDGVVVDSGLGADKVAGKLGQTTRSAIAVRVDGSTFTYPERLDGMQPGDEALVYADVPEGTPVRISVGGAAAYEASVGDVERPLLERAFSQAHINALLEQEASGPPSTDLHDQIVDLAVRHRLITPYTALLVLETDADYARFGITRRGLASILTVQDGELVDQARSLPTASSPVIAAAKPSPSPNEADRKRGDRPATNAPPPPTAGGQAQAEQRPELSPSTPAMDVQATAQAAPPPPPPPPSPAAAPAGARPEAPASRPSPRPAAKAAADMDDEGPRTGDLRLGSGGGAVNPGSRGSGGLSGIGGGGSSAGAGVSAASRDRGPVAAVRPGTPTVSGGIATDVIVRIVRNNSGRFRACYQRGLNANPSLQGRVSVRFTIDKAGAVSSASDGGSTLGDASTISCVVHSFTNMSFPQPENGAVNVVFPLVFTTQDGGGGGGGGGDVQQSAKPAVATPYSGKFGEVMSRLDKKDVAGAKAAAQAWHDEEPGDILGLIALGETLEANKEDERAARAYGTLIDLFPARADMRRFAGSRLERVKTAGLPLALDTYTKAKEQRPDHPSSHRLLVYALLKSGAHEKAFQAAVDALHKGFIENRFPGVHQILQEDVGLVGSAWVRAEPKRAGEIATRIMEAGGKLENAPSIRFVLTWETDANDVDFHIYDSAGGHAFYSQKHLPSGGDLYADITTGYGPECFTIRGPKEKRPAQYTLQANYYSRGPMGYGMGKLEVIEHDGKGNLTFEEHPYVVMVDHAFVNLGVIKK